MQGFLRTKEEREKLQEEACIGGNERRKQARAGAKGKFMAQFEMVRQYAVNSLAGTGPCPTRYSALSSDKGSTGNL